MLVRVRFPRDGQWTRYTYVMDCQYDVEPGQHAIVLSYTKNGPKETEVLVDAVDVDPKDCGLDGPFRPVLKVLP